MDKRQVFHGRRYIFGFILILIGLVMILERAGILSWEVYDFILSWKMLLVAIGAFVFFSGNRGAGIIVMGVGAFFMLPDIFEDYGTIRRFFWPALLLLAGLVFIFGRKPSGINAGKKWEPNTEAKMEVNNDFFDEVVIFGGKEISMLTDNFLGGRTTSIFGGIEIDLRKCQIAPDGCTIEVTTLFGGNTLKLPNDWTVLNRVTTIFGGFTDTRIKDPMYSPNPSKTIVITGVCIFGGTDIRNYNKIH